MLNDVVVCRCVMCLCGVCDTMICVVYVILCVGYANVR
jgi:hypothetical protein